MIKVFFRAFGRIRFRLLCLPDCRVFPACFFPSETGLRRSGWFQFVTNLTQWIEFKAIFRQNAPFAVRPGGLFGQVTQTVFVQWWDNKSKLILNLCIRRPMTIKGDPLAFPRAGWQVKSEKSNFKPYQALILHPLKLLIASGLFSVFRGEPRHVYPRVEN